MCEYIKHLWILDLVIAISCWRCILTPSRDLACIEAAAPINPICVQLLHHQCVGVLHTILSHITKPLQFIRRGFNAGFTN
jgi:hypothetical protein